MNVPLIEVESSADRRSRSSSSVKKIVPPTKASLLSNSNPMFPSSSSTAFRGSSDSNQCSSTTRLLNSSFDGNRHNGDTCWSDYHLERLLSIELLHEQSRTRLPNQTLQSLLSPSDQIMSSRRTPNPKCCTMKLTVFALEKANGTSNAHSSTKSDENSVLGDCTRGDCMSVDVLNMIPDITRIEVNERGFFWVRIQDLSCLPILAAKFELHDSYVSGFTDTRAQSTFLQTHSSFFLSLCTFEGSHREDTNDNACQMRKLCICVTSKVIISYEMVFTLETNDRPDGAQTAQSSADDTCGDYVGESVTADAKENYEKYYEYGIGYLLANLLNEFLCLQNSILDNCHRGLSFYESQVQELHDHVVERIGIESARGGVYSNELAGDKVREIESCLTVLLRKLDEVQMVLAEVCTATSIRINSELHRVLNPLTKVAPMDSGPFLHNVKYTARYAASSLQHAALKACHLHKNLKAIVQIRERRTGVRIRFLLDDHLLITINQATVLITSKYSSNDKPFLNPHLWSWFRLCCPFLRQCFCRSLSSQECSE